MSQGLKHIYKIYKTYKIFFEAFGWIIEKNVSEMPIGQRTGVN